MKKEYIIFLVLVVCAAMVSGSALAITINYPYIQQGVKNQQTAAQEKKTEQAAEKVAQQPQQHDTALTTASTENGKAVQFTEVEQLQIEEMLNSLGKQDSVKCTEFIKDFQSKHSLEPTGNLDQSTLNEIVRQVTIMKTSEVTRT